MKGMEQLKKNWSEQPAYFSAYALACLIVLVLSGSSFVGYVATREDQAMISFIDPILRHLPALQMDWFIFGLLYFGLIHVISWLFVHQPRWLTHAFLSYSLLMVFRVLGVWLLPLDPPPGSLVLNDPFVQLFHAEHPEPLTKDLFFSGHVSTGVFLYLFSPSEKWRRVYIFYPVVIGLLVMLQQVHYTIDVVAAPFFAYGSYKLAGRVQEYVLALLPEKRKIVGKERGHLTT